MIKRLFALFVCICVLGLCHCFAQVKPYLAIVDTGKEIFRGVLYQVTPDSLGLKRDEAVVFFNASDIRKIKVKELTRSVKYKKYLSYDPYNEKNYEKVTRKMVPVRKWGEKGPTMEEELSGRIITSMYSTAINSVFSSLGLSNNCISTLKLNHDTEKYRQNVEALAFHSILYQSNPGSLAELKSARTSHQVKGN